ncbi:MAG: hypothetical protein AAGF47_05035 [Planctomycetota bacterium]
MLRSSAVFFGVVFAVGSAAPALAGPPAIGTIIAAGDEWIFSDQAYDADAVQASRLALNIADAMAGGQAGADFLVYTTENRVRNGNLAATMTDAGYGWDRNTTLTFDLPTLQTYDGIWLSGDLGRSPAEMAVLQDYVTQGGSVFVLGGTSGSGAEIAAAWNPLLSLGGLAFDDEKFPGSFTASFEVNAGSSTLDDGVSSIFWGNGQNVLGVTGVQPDVGSIEFVTADFSGEVFMGQALSSAEPIIGIFQIPAPSGLAVLAAAGLAATRRRRG